MIRLNTHRKWKHSTSRGTNINQIQMSFCRYKTAKIFNQGESLALNVIKGCQSLTLHLSYKWQYGWRSSSPPVADRTIYHRQANYKEGPLNKPLCATTQVTNDPLIQGGFTVYCTQLLLCTLRHIDIVAWLRPLWFSKRLLNLEHRWEGRME